MRPACLLLILTLILAVVQESRATVLPIDGRIVPQFVEAPHGDYKGDPIAVPRKSHLNHLDLTTDTNPKLDTTDLPSLKFTTEPGRY